jgi:hypothetical protein
LPDQYRHQQGSRESRLGTERQWCWAVMLYRPGEHLPTPQNPLSQRAGARETRLVDAVRSYVICCVQRSESWLLAHTLADTGYAGRPSDYFDDAERENHAREWGLPVGDLAAYVRAVRERAMTPNGVLGSKLMWNDFDSLRSSLCPPAGAVVRIKGNSALRGRLRRSRTGQARRRQRSPEVSSPSATRRPRPSARALPQAGRRADRHLRRSRPLSDEFPGRGRSAVRPRP